MRRSREAPGGALTAKLLLAYALAAGGIGAAH